MTIDFSAIRVDLHEHERWRRTLAFTVPAAVLQAERKATVAQLALRLRMPGFRKGKAPLAAVERQYAQTIERETLERVIGEIYRRALEERDLEPITEGEVEGVELTPEGELTFKASFEVRPVIQLSRLGGFRIERPSARVDPSQVEQVLARLVRENAIWRPPDDHGTPRDGDLVTVHIVPLGDGGSSQNVGLPWARRLQLRADTAHRGRYQFVLGAGDAVPDLEHAVRSLSPGETGEFTVRTESEPPGSDARPGDTVLLPLRVTLEDRRMQERPELDDAFARSLGDFADLTELRQKILDDLEAEAEHRAESVVRDRLIEQLLSANPFQAPLSMVEGESEAAVKRALLLSAVAETRGLEATAEEIEARISQVASLGGVTPAEVRARLVQTNRLESLARDITERKVFDFLVGHSQIVDEG